MRESPSVPVVCALCGESCPPESIDWIDAPGGPHTAVCAACSADLHEHCGVRRLDTDALEAEGTGLCIHCGEDEPLLALNADRVCIACERDIWVLYRPANDNARVGAPLDGVGAPL